MFTKTSAETSGAPRPATGTKDAPFSIIGGGVVLVGNISATADLHIDGRIDGDVACAALVQGVDSVICGNIVAHSARIAGTVEGAISVDELILEGSSRVVGDCTFGTLTVATGAQVQGRFVSGRSAGAHDLTLPGALIADRGTLSKAADAPRRH